MNENTIRTVRIAAANALADVPEAQLKPEFLADFNKALREYRTSLDSRADFRGGQFEKGHFFERLGQLHLAEKAYLKAIKLDNHFNMARLNLAHLYNRLRKNEQAISLFKTVIEQEPNYGMAYYSLGLLYAEENKLEFAGEYLAKAAELEGNPRVFYNLGIVYQKLEQPSQAEKTYLKGLQLDDNDFDLRYALGILYFQQGEMGKAKPHIEILLKVQPQNGQLNRMWKMIHHM